MDEDQLMMLLQSLPPEEIEAMFQPFQQDQNVLDQQMALATQLRDRPQQSFSTPGGAIAGGLAGALGQIGGAYGQGRALKGQQELGQRMQGDASGRIQAWLADALRKRKAQEEQAAMTEQFNVSPGTMLE